MGVGVGVAGGTESLTQDFGLFRCWDVQHLIQIMLTLHLNLCYWFVWLFCMTGPQLFKAV